MEFRYSFVFLPICWENKFSFFRLKSLNTAAVTEQTTEAVDWKLTGFIQRGRIHWNFSHSISMVWHFPRYWSFVRGIHRSPVNPPMKGQWHGALMLSLICAWTNSWVNYRDAGDLSLYRARYDVTVMRWRSDSPWRSLCWCAYRWGKKPWNSYVNYNQVKQCGSTS